MKRLPTAMVALGALTMSAGLALWSLAAGIMLLGAFAMAAGILMIRGGEDNEQSGAGHR